MKFYISCIFFTGCYCNEGRYTPRVSFCLHRRYQNHRRYCHSKACIVERLTFIVIVTFIVRSYQLPLTFFIACNATLKWNSTAISSQTPFVSISRELLLS